MKDPDGMKIRMLLVEFKHIIFPTNKSNDMKHLNSIKYMNYMNYLFVCLLIAFVGGCSDNDTDDVQTQKEHLVATDGGYLFAHMTPDDYAHLYYSVSRDAYNWETLNDGKIILTAYKGHPDICQGKDGVFYMIGVDSSTRSPILWSSSDLVTWNGKRLLKSIFNKITELYGYINEEAYYGAPKIFYDESSEQYIITWHAGKTGDDSDNEEWKSKRTFYILTKDFVNFSDPQFLFNFTGSDENMATIDVIIRKIEGTYCAVIKDERWSDDAPETAKTIRIAKSDFLTGPYTNPGSSITPVSVQHEAPILVPTVDDNGFFLYAERYPYQYDMYEASSIDGPWTERYFCGPKARHGCIVRINETLYQGILKAYKK